MIQLQSSCKELAVIEEIVLQELMEKDFRFPAIKIFEKEEEMRKVLNIEQVEIWNRSKTKATYQLGKNQVYLFVPFFEKYPISPKEVPEEVRDTVEYLQDMVEEMQLFHHAFHEIRHSYQEQYWGLDFVRACHQREDAHLVTNPLDLDANRFAYEMGIKYKDIIRSFVIDSQLIDFYLNRLREIILI